MLPFKKCLSMDSTCFMIDHSGTQFLPASETYVYIAKTKNADSLCCCNDQKGCNKSKTLLLWKANIQASFAGPTIHFVVLLKTILRIVTCRRQQQMDHSYAEVAQCHAVPVPFVDCLK